MTYYIPSGRFFFTDISPSEGLLILNNHYFNFPPLHSFFLPDPVSFHQREGQAELTSSGESHTTQLRPCRTAFGLLMCGIEPHQALGHTHVISVAFSFCLLILQKALPGFLLWFFSLLLLRHIPYACIRSCLSFSHAREETSSSLPVGCRERLLPQAAQEGSHS